MQMFNRRFVIFIVALTLIVSFNLHTSGSAEIQPPELTPVVRSTSRWDTSPPLRDLALNQSRMLAPDQAFEIPLHSLPISQLEGAVTDIDSVVQKSFLGVSAPPTIANFEGLNNVNGVLPPDTNGDIGPNHYVQIVNLSFAVYDRSGTLLLGPLNNNTIFQDFGGPCETTNNGDPIVLYDQLADRWLLSQFALPNYPYGPFYQCIAVSATGDPTGQWHRYEFLISQSKLNDYPKFGVWPDGYYMTVNQFEYDSGWDWAGQGVAAFERDQMLVGAPARMVIFDLYEVDGTLGGMLPADLDGPQPPLGSPNPFAMMNDNTWEDQLQIWNFSVNWASPSNSTFLFQVALSTASFDSNMCNYSRNCIPQPGGNNVDAISDRLMYRLQYRNFGDHQSLVVNHTVDTGGDLAGVRWYEMRKTGGGWSIFQQGTWAPDSRHRWMGSVAMNGRGDIGLGYSVSSTTTHPSIRFTGRLSEDPAGQMTFSEGEIISGSGYQTSSSGRWGDYSMMAVDPVDDCTFWYTQEYYTIVGGAPWQTRIASFKLRECGNPTILYFPLIYK
ncbi:hypothetical protein ACFLV7_08435 [Chloroflexota bacterium]